ncbi:MAG: NAD-dependent deacylase [Acidobacteria bacterium]|nr:NAD-dependent deacylase [Acidobacteriota bacterium]
MPTDELQALLSASRSVCVLTGAGVSQESGIPTFRGTDGLWRKYRAEDLATPEAFARDPLLVWEWYAWRRELIHRAQPNAAHRALAALQEQWSAKPGQFWLVTQNVDGLHDLAGSRNVIRLHGDFWLLRCTRCGAERRDLSVPLNPFPPRCARRECSATMRPGVVWFGEALPEQEWQQAAIAAGSCDLFLVVGTSGLVYPAASLPLLAKENGARLVEINPFPTMLSDVADLVIREKAVDALGKLETRTSTQ